MVKGTSCMAAFCVLESVFYFIYHYYVILFLIFLVWNNFFPAGSSLDQNYITGSKRNQRGGPWREDKDSREADREDWSQTKQGEKN